MSTERKLAGEDVPLIPLGELAELNPGMGPKELTRLQMLEQLLAEDDLKHGLVDGEGTGCAIHPVAANPFCDTCREHGNPHPFDGL